MAKRGTLTHRRTRRLAKRLGIPLPYALGVMEAVWHVTAENTPRGNIGQMTNRDICDEAYLEGDPDELVAALVDAEVLEPHDEFRLVVHGWSEHADRATRHKLARAHLTFWDGHAPFEKRAADEDERPADDHSVSACAHERTSDDGARPRSLEIAPVQCPASSDQRPVTSVQRPASSDQTNNTPQTPRASAGGSRPRAAPSAARHDRKHEIREAADRLERYWISLGGHPSAEDRSRIRDQLRAGVSIAEFRRAIAARVRGDLIRAGKLDDESAWPPPGLEPDESLAEVAS